MQQTIPNPNQTTIDAAAEANRSAREAGEAATRSTREAADASRPCAAPIEHLRECADDGNRAELQSIADGIARQQNLIKAAADRLLKEATAEQA